MVFPTPTLPQKGLLYSPGRSSALMVWRLKSPSRCVDVCDAAARLMDRLAEQDTVRWVVGVSPHFVEGADAGALLPREGPGGTFPSTQGSVFLQLAGKTYSDIAPLLRLATSILSPWLWLDEEVRGGQLGDGREPFGFRDGLETPTKREIIERVTIPGGALAGGSWLLYLRFVQALDRFAALRPGDQERVMGMTREGEPLPEPPDDAHTVMAKTYRDRPRFVRRGFPYRAHGDEGLAFIAAGADTVRFATAIDLMLGAGSGRSPDALLRYAWPVGGGVYLAPATADKLRELGRTHVCEAGSADESAGFDIDLPSESWSAAVGTFPDRTPPTPVRTASHPVSGRASSIPAPSIRGRTRS